MSTQDRPTPDMAQIYADSLLSLASRDAEIVRDGRGEIGRPRLYIRAHEVARNGTTVEEVAACITRNIDAILHVYGLRGSGVQIVLAVDRLEIERLITTRLGEQSVLDVIEGLGIKVEWSTHAIGIARLHGEALS